MKKKLVYLICSILLLFGCKSQEKEDTHEFTNELIKESSPYLLQHAHNPVNWKAWNEETLKKAKESHKLLLISVGYAACHWCHVMEKESFEDSTVAAIMNSNFINIKIDKEERPDIDQVYMNAVQLMTGRGGWPLNVIALPDGRPIWGGTYFTKGDWLNALQQVNDTYSKNPEKLEEYATRLESGMQQMSLVTPNPNTINFDKETLKSFVQQWMKTVDYENGGATQVPKFMMPSNYHFLMRYAHQLKNDTVAEHTFHTLDKISYGGVYDHISGGFSRYSTDTKWHIPHFEKMLYDNGQLVSLYSEAFSKTKNDWYKQVVSETLEFVNTELTSKEGAFYSSLDADSVNDNNELEEGTYYVWSKEELKQLLTSDFELFADYYNVNDYGYWEDEKYVLIKNISNEAFAQKNQITLETIAAKQKEWKNILHQEKIKRKQPRLDDKVLTSWNALMLKGYVDAYKAFQEASYLNTAKQNAEFLIKNQLEADGRLWHNFKNGKSSINGYLEDYATVIEAFLALYEVTLDNNYLELSKKMADYVHTHFYDVDSDMYFFTSDLDTSLVTRNLDTSDQVIPSSNSILANNYFKLYHYFSDTNYLERSKKMLHNMLPTIAEYPSGYSNWLNLYLNFSETFYEVVVTGEQAISVTNQLQQHYYPNTLLAGTTSDSNNPLFKGRYKADGTYIFICQDNACKFPVTEVNEALQLMQE